MEKYENKITWKKIQKFLPEHNRITEEFYPIEEAWNWNGNQIHLDRYVNPSADKKVILLHGGGGNGRLLSFMGIPLLKEGYEVVAPDLPGYGLSKINDGIIDYQMWVNLVDDLIDKEYKKDPIPIILMGFSIGGMLTYHTACLNNKVSGLIATNLMDQRQQVVRDSLAFNKLVSRIGTTVIDLLDKINGNIQLPMKFIANMKEIVNHDKVLKILLNDKTGAGNSMSVRYINSFINYNPAIEPDEFNQCPLLLAHPAEDKWTDLNISKIFFDQLSCPKELKMLDNAGHFPIESPGLQQLEEYTNKFISQL